MKRGVWVGLATVIVVCGGGAFGITMVQKLMSAKPVTKAPDVKVARGDVGVTVVESGKLQAFKTVEVKSRVSGRVAKLMVDEGNLVEAGQLIAIIDPQETELQVEQNAAQLRGAIAGSARQDIEIGQRRVTVSTGLERARAALRQVQMELKVQPTLTSSAIVSAKSSLAQAVQARDQLSTVTHPNARVSAETSLSDARVGLENARLERQRQERLLEKGYISRREYDNSVVQEQLSASKLTQSTEILDRLAKSHGSDMAQARERVQQAQSDYDRALANSIQDGVKREQYRQALLGVREAQAQLRDVEALQAGSRQQRAQVDQLRTVLRDGRRQLGETRILSPITGVVTKRFVQIGELVASLNSFSAGSPIVRVEDRAKMQVKLFVNEIDTAKLSIGTVAKVDVDAIAGTSFEGRVTKIAPTSMANSAAGGASDPVVKYEVEVTLLGLPGALKSGMSAKCSLKVAARRGVLRIPTDYLGKDSKGNFVMVASKTPKPGDPGTRTEVVIGARTTTYVEIVQGVAEGQLLVKPAFSGPDRRGMMSVGVDE